MLYSCPLCEQRTRSGNCSFGLDYFYHWKCLSLHATNAAAGTNEWVAQKWEWGRDLLPLVEASVSAFLRVEFTPLLAEGMVHSCTPCSYPVFKSHFSSSRASPRYWEPCLTMENWKTSPLPLQSGWAALSSVQGSKTPWHPTTALNPCPLSQKRGNPGIKSSPSSIAMKKVRCLLFPLLLVFLYSPCKFW